MKTDARYVVMRERFSRLSVGELECLLQGIQSGEIVYDEYNYYNGFFCPLAYAKGFKHRNDIVFTELGVMQALAKEGFNPVNILRGLEGDFYHGTTLERKRDLTFLVYELLCK